MSSKHKIVELLITPLIVSFCIIAFQNTDLRACDVAVVSADASGTGRPILWKNRDNVDSYRQELQFFGAGGQSGSPSVNNPNVVYNSLQVWGETSPVANLLVCSSAVNEAGLAISNTTIIELNWLGIIDIVREMNNVNTELLSVAAEECATLEDFEALLANFTTRWTNKCLCGNFAVIDAQGGAAVYEIWTDGIGKTPMYRKFNAVNGEVTTESGSIATDVSDAPPCLGFANRTNSHHTDGWVSKKSDTPRELRANQLMTALNNNAAGPQVNDYLEDIIYDPIDDITLNYRSFIQLVTKDVCGGNCYLYNDDTSSDGGNGDDWWEDHEGDCRDCTVNSLTDYLTQYCISKNETTMAFVVDGAAGNNEFSLARVTAWVILGEPSYGVSIPFFPYAGEISLYAYHDKIGAAYNEGNKNDVSLNGGYWNGTDETCNNVNSGTSFLNMQFDYYGTNIVSPGLYSNNGRGVSIDRTMNYSSLQDIQPWTFDLENTVFRMTEQFLEYAEANWDEVGAGEFADFTDECAKYVYDNFHDHYDDPDNSEPVENDPWDYPWDDVSPWVDSETPPENAAEIALESGITASFSEAIEETTLTDSTFTLTNGFSNIDGTITYNDDPDSRTVMFTPHSDLNYSCVYTVTLTTGIEDISGNSLIEKTWSFQTIDMVSVMNPPDSIVPILRPGEITATFNVPMDALTVNEESFTMYNFSDSLAVSGLVTYDSDTMKATFIPDETLLYETQYLAVINTDAEDSGGNRMASSFAWTFVVGVDNDPPVITSRSPSSGSGQIPIAQDVSITFNEPMNVDTVNAGNILLYSQGLMENVDGNLMYEGSSNTVIFTPLQDLDYNTEYTVIVTEDIQDQNSVYLLEEITWSFVTVPEPEGGSTTNNPGNTKIDEAVDPGNKVSSGGCGCGTAANAGTIGGSTALVGIINIFANILFPFFFMLICRLFRRRSK